MPHFDKQPEKAKSIKVELSFLLVRFGSIPYVTTPRVCGQFTSVEYSLCLARSGPSGRLVEDRVETIQMLDKDRNGNGVH
jgi:hypothetical protein